MEYARGEIIAFLDDDAYPEPCWLKNALVNFDDPEVAAVGGPAVTPDNDSLAQKASGAIYSTVLVSGQYVYRYIPREKLFVEDFPSCNFLVRKAVMLELGGFKTDFWPGEDTKLCLDITKRLSKKIIYDPKVKVYHHRRAVFSGHLKQIASYAYHRGYFVKRYPETSLKPAYFVPSLFLFLLALGGILAAVFPVFQLLYFSCLSLYLFIILVFSLLSGKKVSFGLKGIGLAVLIIDIFIGIILTHLFYGLYFIKGILAHRLREESLI